MATPPAFFHALLRPAMLQILRTTGYHATRPAVLDALTDLAARYLQLLCQRTAAHAASSRRDGAMTEQPDDFTVLDVRLALQDMGCALGPERSYHSTATGGSGEGESKEDDEEEAEAENGRDDGDDGEMLLRVQELVAWLGVGQRMRELTEAGTTDGESEAATDYLSALKKKHNQAGGDAKFQGTILGRPADGSLQVLVEGGPVTTIAEWMAERSPDMLMLLHPAVSSSSDEKPSAASPSGSSSSGLSSVASLVNVDGHDDMMDLS